MANSVFQIVISAYDGASAVVRRINREFNTVARPINNLGKSLSSISRESGLTTLGKSLSGIAREAGDVATNLGRMAGPLQTIGGFAGAGGVASLAFRWGNLARQIDLTRQFTSLNTTEVQRWMGAAERAGVKGDVMNQTLRDTSQLMQDMATGRNQNARGIAQLLGIDAGSLHQVRDVSSFLKDFSQSIQGLLPQEQTAAINAMGFQQIAPLLIKGKSAIEEYMGDVDKYIYVQTPEAIDQGNKFAASQFKLGLVLSGLASQIGQNLIPMIDGAISGTRDWIVANQGLSQSIVLIGGGAAALLGSFGILGFIFKGLGGGARFLHATLALLGKGFGFVFAAAGTLMLRLSYMGFIGARLGAFILALGGGFLRLAAIFTGPIGWAITGVITAGWLLIENWTKIKNWWKGLWGGMGDDAKQGASKIANNVNNAPIKPSGNAALGSYINPVKSRSEQMGIDAPSTSFDNTSGNVDLSRNLGGRRGSKRISMQPIPWSDFGGPYAGGNVPLAPPPSKSQLEVLFKNAPDGMRVNSNSTGIDTNVRIQHSMPGQMSP